MEYKLLFCFLLMNLFISCHNNAEKNADEEAETSDIITDNPQDIYGSRSIDDTVAKQMMDLFGMEGETFHDMMKTDSLEREIMALFSEEGLQKMLAESNLSKEEIKKIIENVEKMKEKKSNSADKNLQNDTRREMDVYFKELESLLAGSGSEAQLKALKAMMEKNNIDDQIGGLTKERIDPTTENLRKIIGTDQRSFIEDDLTTYSIYGGNNERKEAMRALATASEKEGNAILATYFQISEKEVELLKKVPANPKISSVKAAERVIDYEWPAAIANHLKNGKPSQKFQILTGNYMRDSKLKAKQFIDRAASSKKEFYDLNPGWYGGGETGNSYVDASGKIIYLPLGALSFADAVISHKLGKPPGSHQQGAIGEPDMSTEKFDKADPKICNLGERGVLTLEFKDNTLADVNGPDLYVFEMGQIEPTNLEISKDGKTWIEVGKIKGGTAKVDIASFIKKGETYNYVRLTDLASQSALPGADVDAVAAIGGALRLNLNSAVLFDTGKFKLKDNASDELQKLVKAIRTIPKARIVVEGHTDNVGDPASNKTLSDNRAKEVSRYLQKNLSTTYTFDTAGYGENQPVASNDTNENRQKNRRVEILVIPN